jgi:hypothetical protein
LGREHRTARKTSGLIELAVQRDDCSSSYH